MITTTAETYYRKQVCRWGTGLSVRQQFVGGAAVCRWGTGLPVGQQFVGGATVCRWGRGLRVGQGFAGGAAIHWWDSGWPVGQRFAGGAAVCGWSRPRGHSDTHHCRDFLAAFRGTNQALVMLLVMLSYRLISHGTFPTLSSRARRRPRSAIVWKMERALFTRE